MVCNLLARSEVNIQKVPMMSRLISAAVFGLVALIGGGAHAGKQAPSCTYSAADGMRQNANLLLFLVDAHLARHSTAMNMPDAISTLKPAEPFETRDAQGKPEHWIYFAAPETANEDGPAQPQSIPSLELVFGPTGQLETLQQLQDPCHVEVADPTKAETLALLAQQQRLKAAVSIALDCNCITREQLLSLANWADADSLDLPRSTMNLFQPYVAFGPEILAVSDEVIQVTPVTRNPQTLGHVKVEELSEGLSLGVRSGAATRLSRTIPYYER